MCVGGVGDGFPSLRGTEPRRRGKPGSSPAPPQSRGPEAGNAPPSQTRPGSRRGGSEPGSAEGSRGQTRPRPLRARGRMGPDWVAGNRSPSQDPPSIVGRGSGPALGAGGRARLSVPAESPCHFPRQLGLPPRGTSFEAALAGTKEGAVQQPGSEKTESLPFFSSSFYNCMEEGWGTCVKDRIVVCFPGSFQKQLRKSGFAL